MKIDGEPAPKQKRKNTVPNLNFDSISLGTDETQTEHLTGNTSKPPNEDKVRMRLL